MASLGDYVPVSCSDYEPLEMACMDHYVIELTVNDGRRIAGNAVELVVRGLEEFLALRRDDGTTEHIRVDRIRHMVVLSRPCRFDRHCFETRGVGSHAD
jgi:Rho-binding antiterminator